MQRISEVMNRQVLTRDGRLLGTVRDALVEQASGRISHLILYADDSYGDDSALYIPWMEVRGVQSSGRFQVVEAHTR